MVGTVFRQSARIPRRACTLLLLAVLLLPAAVPAAAENRSGWRFESLALAAVAALPGGDYGRLSELAGGGSLQAEFGPRSASRWGLSLDAFALVHETTVTGTSLFSVALHLAPSYRLGSRDALYALLQLGYGPVLHQSSGDWGDCEIAERRFIGNSIFGAVEIGDRITRGATLFLRSRYGAIVEERGVGPLAAVELGARLGRGAAR